MWKDVTNTKALKEFTFQERQFWSRSHMEDSRASQSWRLMPALPEELQSSDSYKALDPPSLLSLLILEQMEVCLLRAWLEVQDGDWRRKTSAGLNPCLWRRCGVPSSAPCPAVLLKELFGFRRSGTLLCLVIHTLRSTKHISGYQINTWWLAKRISECRNATGSILGPPPTRTTWSEDVFSIEATQCYSIEKWDKIFRLWLDSLFPRKALVFIRQMWPLA